MNKTLITISVFTGALLVAVTASSAPLPQHHLAQQPNPAEILHRDMRRLWSDHVIWTRDYIVAAVAGQPDQQAAAGRLMRNQEDIGSAIAAYYGSAADAKLTALLKEHISIAVDLITAAKAGDNAAQQRADAAWHRNAEDIARFLGDANANWPRSTLLDMMNTHLSTTTQEVVARLTGDWGADVRAFDAVYDHILHMADTLSDGIVAQFPDRFIATSKS